MVVTSADWPRFSFLAGTATAYACAASYEVETRVLELLSASKSTGFTWECWFQMRRSQSLEPPDAGDNPIRIHGCWIVHTPTWACGATAEGELVLFHDGLWSVSSLYKEDQDHTDGLLDARLAWKHLAVVYESREMLLKVFLDGEQVVLTPIFGNGDAVNLSISLSDGFRVGWSPLQESNCMLALYECRCWETALSIQVCSEWSSCSLSSRHPHLNQLVGYWSFSSGTASDREMDLSDNRNDLSIRRFQSTCWRLSTPPRFAPSTDEMVKMSTYQDSSTDKSSCRFVLDFETYRTASAQPITRGTIVFLLNFECYKSPSVAAEGKGVEMIALLKAAVSQMDENTRVAVCVVSDESQPNQDDLFVSPPLAMDSDNKARVLKKLDHVTIQQTKLLSEVYSSIPRILADERLALPTDYDKSVLTWRGVIAVNDHVSPAAEAPEEASLLLKSGSQSSERYKNEVHILHIGEIVKSSSTSNIVDRAITEYTTCKSDVEWVLASVIHRFRHIRGTDSRLVVRLVGDGEIQLDNDLALKLQWYNKTNQMKEAEVPIGLCADHEKLMVSGSFIAHSTDNGLPLAEVCFSQQVCDALRRDVRVSIRLSEDLQDEVHIARRLRNKLLGVDEKNGLLWDQRRQLMKEKVYFTTGILSQEVANAENSFKKVNIMKEELWAKRSWISDRALRLFEEQELARLETESDVAKQRLKERMDILSSRFTVSNRVSSRGNNSRGSNSRGNIQGKLGERTSVSTHPEHNDNEASSSNDPEQKLHKLHLKLDLQTKQFVEMESKMEDMLVSVRLAEAKGPVIMNDARKTWIVRYRDLIHAKKQVYQLTLQKDALERQILGQEADVQAQNEVSTEAQALKTAIARYEKDLVKRRKQVMLSMKEVQGSVIDAFDAVARVIASNHALRRARQMKTMTLSPEMYISSVYVCFPLEYSHYEIPTPRVRQLASFVHCLLFGLRHYCYSDNQTPICRRLSFGKSFLWWGIEQELDIEIDNAITSRSEARFQVQHMSWAVIVLTYNGLFSSALAMGEVREVLEDASKTSKPVIHIEMEPPFANLEEFKTAWRRRNSITTPDQTPRIVYSVEKEFLVWRQNFAVFQRLFAAVEDKQSMKFEPTCFSCDQCWSSTDSKSHEPQFFPCLDCCQPFIATTLVSCEEDSSRARLTALVTNLGTWIDLIVSPSLQSAPRSYHIDPNAVSAHSVWWEQHLQDSLAQQTQKWETAVGRRKKDVERQLHRLFRVYEDETRDLTSLRFQCLKQQQRVMKEKCEQKSILHDEKRLPQTWLELMQDDDLSPSANQAREREIMLCEELEAHLSCAEITIQELESMEDREVAPHELVEAKQRAEMALKRSSRAILSLSRARVDDHLRNVTRNYRVEDYTAKIAFAEERCAAHEMIISRISLIFSEATRTIDTLQGQRESTVLEDARDFFHAAVMEISPFSDSTADIDANQLRNLAVDLQAQLATCVSIWSEGLIAELAAATAKSFRGKVNEAVVSFQMTYAPIASLAANDHYQTVPFKDYCQFAPDSPLSTWNSFLEMLEYADSEALNLRQARQLYCCWKRSFMEALGDLYVRHWWSTCQSFLIHVQERLGELRALKNKSFTTQDDSTRAFSSVVRESEDCRLRLDLLQRRISEMKERQATLLHVIHISRNSYDAAVAAMGRLHNYKMDPIFKSWHSIGDHHVGLTGDIFDLRARCAIEIELLESDISKMQDRMTKLQVNVKHQRLHWIKESIADLQICEFSDRTQEIAHAGLNLVLELEAHRVFQWCNAFDSRSKWLHKATFDRWRKEDQVLDAQRSVVDDDLVELTIARLDKIRQHKWRDNLKRKLHIFEAISAQETVKLMMAQEEAEKYRHIGSFLTERVKFIRDSVERAQQSIVLIEDTTKNAEKAAPGFFLLRGCQEAIYTLATAAQRDFLAIDARMCQLSWHGQQHFTSNLRTQQIMEDVRAELQHVEDYLQVLRKKADTVYKVGTHKRSSTAKLSSDETGDQGMRIPAVQAVYEFYARQQWSRLCLSETTAIGERVGLLRKSLEAASKNASPGAETEQGNEEVDDLLQRLRVVELSALLNRFECRIAEKTSESLRELLTKPSWDANDPEMANRPQDFLNAVLPLSKLQRWMFNVSLFTVDKEKMLESLRQVTTEDDPRDIGGNLSEVIFGASLDQNAIEQVYLVKSKTHVDEQWNVALVVLFFARLFRRTSLRKAALQRKVEGSKFTTQRLEQIQRSRKFIEYLTSSTRNGQDAAAFEPSMRELLHHVVLHRHEYNASFPLQRVIYGLSTNRPCHRLLGLRNTNQHQEIVQLADSFDDAMAIAGHRPPRPTGLEVVQIDKYSVKIQWTQAPSELGLIHVSEITEWKAKYADSFDSTKIFWQQFVSTEKTSHTFYNLSLTKAYWVRVRAGFSRTRLGEACYPLFVTLGPL